MVGWYSPGKRLGFVSSIIPDMRSQKVAVVVTVGVVLSVCLLPARTEAAANGSTSPASSSASSEPAVRMARAASTRQVSGTSKKLPGTKCRVFPANNYWHADISALPVNARSAQWMAHTDAADTDLHPDFGPSFGEQPVPYGIPVTIVKGKPKKVKVKFGYSDESDHRKYPLNRKTKIEGGASASGDRHAIVVDARTCTLYETWDTHKRASGWYAGSGAVWSLKSNALRPAGWTSADAAGLPILPGLLRWDEIQSGKVDHAIRFTVEETSNSYLWPARHRAGGSDDLAYPPMGARFRLKAGFDLSGYSAQARTVLTAMAHYGLVLADNGSNWYFQGTSDSRWPDSLISELKGIPASAFEAVDTSSLQGGANSGRVRS